MLTRLIDTASWEAPRVFQELQQIGHVDDDEMRRVFNMGIGMVVVVPEASASLAVAALRAAGQHARVIGEIGPGSGQVAIN